MADKKDEKPGGPVSILDYELALLTHEANGASVIRRGTTAKAKCPKCEHEADISVTEFFALDAVLRLNTCGICRHEFRDGTAKAVDSTGLGF